MERLLRKDSGRRVYYAIYGVWGGSRIENIRRDVVRVER